MSKIVLNDVFSQEEIKRLETAEKANQVILSLITNGLIEAGFRYAEKQQPGVSFQGQKAFLRTEEGKKTKKKIEEIISKIDKNTGRNVEKLSLQVESGIYELTKWMKNNF